MKTTIIATALVAAAGAAQADSMGSLKMKHQGGGSLLSGLQYRATVDGDNVSASVAGEIRHKTKNRSGAARDLPQYMSSFCIELGQSTSNGYRTFEVRSILDAPNPESNSPHDAGYGQQIQQRIHAVVRAAIDSGIIDARLQPASGATAAELAAVQLGIWEAIWEQGGSIDLTSGNSMLHGHDFTTSNALNTALASLTAQANSFVALSRSEFSSYKVAGLVALTSSNTQDQLAIVPLPPAAFAGLGLLGVAGVARRLRK